MTDPLAKILVADDEPDLRALLQRYLSDQGYTVRTVDGAGPLDVLLQRERFDVLVLDVMMPGEDGLAICRRLRAQGETIPILMLTARGDPVDRIIMNPPFSEGRWQAHTQHAATMVKPGGRLVAILPASAKGKDLLPGFDCTWHGPYDNEFPGTSVSVVILKADRT